jgi:uncharacterized coiled-coil protein SlyX
MLERQEQLKKLENLSTQIAELRNALDELWEEVEELIGYLEEEDDVI